MCKPVIFLSVVLAAGLTGALGAQAPSLDVEQIPCLLVEENGVVKSLVTNNVPETTMRLYFRRLHIEVEDFYWVEMHAKGNGEYWGVFPKPEDEVLARKDLAAIEEQVRDRWARWWRQKELLEDRDPNDDLDQEIIRERASLGKRESRNWMESFDDAALEQWLEELEYEPAEYFTALYDAFGQRLAVSPMRVTQVRDSCSTNLTPAEAGLAQNLTVGETAVWQQGREVFHWLCDGVVSRIDASGIWRGDSLCRACIVAWWQKQELLIPLSALVTTIGVSTFPNDPREISPSRP